MSQESWADRAQDASPKLSLRDKEILGEMCVLPMGGQCYRGGGPRSPKAPAAGCHLWGVGRQEPCAPGLLGG